MKENMKIIDKVNSIIEEIRHLLNTDSVKAGALVEVLGKVDLSVLATEEKELINLWRDTYKEFSEFDDSSLGLFEYSDTGRENALSVLKNLDKNTRDNPVFLQYLLCSFKLASLSHQIEPLMHKIKFYELPTDEVIKLVAEGKPVVQQRFLMQAGQLKSYQRLVNLQDCVVRLSNVADQLDQVNKESEESKTHMTVVTTRFSYWADCFNKTMNQSKPLSNFCFTKLISGAFNHPGMPTPAARDNLEVQTSFPNLSELVITLDILDLLDGEHYYELAWLMDALMSHQLPHATLTGKITTAGFVSQTLTLIKEIGDVYLSEGASDADRESCRHVVSYLQDELCEVSRRIRPLTDSIRDEPYLKKSRGRYECCEINTPQYYAHKAAYEEEVLSRPLKLEIEAFNGPYEISPKTAHKILDDSQKSLVAIHRVENKLNDRNSGSQSFFLMLLMKIKRLIFPQNLSCKPSVVASSLFSISAQRQGVADNSAQRIAPLAIKAS